jgi:hypothetical protein
MLRAESMAMTRLWVCLAAIGLLLCAGAPQAAAQARHERVKVAPIKQKGKVVGATIRARLRPEMHGYNKVQLILGKISHGKYTQKNYRDAAIGKEPGYVLAKGPSFKYAKNGDEVEFKLTYGKGNGLRGGEQVDVTSIWSREGGLHASAPHVWGMTRDGIPSEPITLPK